MCTVSCQYCVNMERIKNIYILPNSSLQFELSLTWEDLGVTLGSPGETLGRPVDNEQSCGYSSKLWTINIVVDLGDLGRLLGESGETLGRPGKL